MALTSIFLRLVIDGKAVEGESQAQGYEGLIEVESLQWSMLSKLLPSDDPKKVKVETRLKHLSFNKVYDAATGKLIRAAAGAGKGAEKLRTPFSVAAFTVTTMVLSSSGADTLTKMVELVLEKGEVEDVSLSASEGKNAVGIKEEVTLSFTKSTLKYYPIDIESGIRRIAPMTFEIEAASGLS